MSYRSSITDLVLGGIPGKSRTAPGANPIDFLLLPGEQDERQSLLTRALDTLQIGQHHSASLARKALDMEPAPEGRPASYLDIIKEKFPYKPTESVAHNFFLGEAPQALAGLAGDILLDPVTYLTFGGSAVVGKTVGKQGLKFLGKEVVPRVAFSKAAEITGLSRVGAAIRGTKAGQALGQMFSPTFRPAGMSKSEWDEFVSMVRDYVNRLNYSKRQAIDTTIEHFISTKVTANERDLILHAVNFPDLLRAPSDETVAMFIQHPLLKSVLDTATRVRANPDRLSKVVKATRTARSLWGDIGREEFERGLLTTLRKKYVPGIYPKKGRGLWTGGRTTRPLRPYLVHRKPKVYPTPAESILEGNEPLTDIAQVMGIRLMRGQSAITTKDFVDDVTDVFGTTINYRPGMEIAEGYGLYLPKGNLRFYPLTALSRKDINKLVAGLPPAKAKTARRVMEDIVEEISTESPSTALSGPVKKMESRVHEALTSRGWTKAEANQMVNRLKAQTGDAGATTITKTITKTISESVQMEGDQLVDITKIAPRIEAALKTLPGVSQQVPGVLLPRPIADHVNRFYKVFTDDEATNAFLRGFDRVQNVWKGYATAANPGFHGRNAMSNIWNLFLKDGLGAVDLRTHKLSVELLSTKSKGTLTTRTGQTFSYDEVRTMLKRYGVRGRGWMGIDIPERLTQQLERQMKGRAEKMVAAFNPASQDFFFLRRGREVGTAIENEARTVGFLNDLIKTGDPSFAAQNTKKFLFDYLELTPFERNVMKRFVPFYTWMRKNLPLQFEYLLKQPGKYAAIPKVARAVAGGKTEEPYEPDYFEDLYAMRLPFKTKSGASLYLNPNLPFQDINRLNPSDLFFMVTPALKAPIELLFDKDAFFGMPISDYRRVPGYVESFPKDLQRVLGVRERINRYRGQRELVMPGRFVYLLNQNPWLANIGRFSAEAKGIEQEDKKFWRSMAWLTGLKLIPHHQGEAMRRKHIQKRFETRERRQQLFKKGKPL